MRARGRVFVTDGMQRKALAAVRGLHRSGFDVVVGESTRFAPALFSRRARERVVHPPPREVPGAFVDALVAALRRHRCDVLLPMEEETLLVVLGARARLERHARIPFPDGALIERMRDKGNLPALAAAAGVSVPRTVLVPPGGDPLRAADAVGFPLVVKPRVSTGAYGLRYVDRPEALPRIYAEVDARFPGPLLQERLPAGGEARCVTLFLDPAGSVRASFAHRRLREYPVTGGAGTARVSLHAPVETAAAVRLLRAAGWWGVAHVEFKRDRRDGRFRLLEVNPRFAGSLHLAVEAGVDFASLLARWALGEVVTPPPYPDGIQARWLLPGDLLAFLGRLWRGRLDRDFFRWGGRRLRFDDWGDGDWFAVVGAALAAGPIVTRHEFRRLLRR